MRSVLILVLLSNAAFAAGKPLEGAIIVIDPGHGGQTYSKSYTGGTRGVNTKLSESELNLRVGLELATILREEGASVHLTRGADHRLSREGSSSQDELHARIDFFEHHACHFFVSVHHNAAGSPKATGHTAIYKHDANDDTLYEALAREVNDELDMSVPGPKRKLIKESYHLTRETRIPATISEAGFLTNPDFDKMANESGFPKTEAFAIARGVRNYWLAHHEALKTLRMELITERATSPRDPKTLTATALNPTFQSDMKAALKKIAPEGKYEAAKVSEYLEKCRKDFPGSNNEIKARYDGKVIILTGKPADRKLHDRFIDVLVAMKLLAIQNEVVVAKAKAGPEKP